MGQYAKAVSALLMAFLGAFLQATLGDSAGGDAVTSNEWVIIVVSSLAAATAVWATSNDNPPTEIK